jgi:hypothetical protein
MNMRKIVILCIAVLIIACGVGVGTEKAEAAIYVSLLYNTTSLESVWLECDYTTTPDTSGYYFYDYTIHLQDFGNYSLPSGYSYYSFLQALKVMNNSKNPVVWIKSPISPDWDFSQAPDTSYYMWLADTLPGDYLTRGSSLNDMEIKSTLPPRHVAAAVWNGATSTSASQTMGPAVEPASMALLGLGLLGLGGVKFRKRFKA